MEAYIDDDLGTLLASPVSAEEVMDAVERALGRDRCSI